MVYVCNACSALFDRPVVKSEKSGVTFDDGSVELYTTISCPNCGSDSLVAWFKCPNCENGYMGAYDIVCVDCQKNVREDFKRIIHRMFNDNEIEVLDDILDGESIKNL